MEAGRPVGVIGFDSVYASPEATPKPLRSRDLPGEVAALREVLGKYKSSDSVWKPRLESVKKLRSLVAGGAAAHPSFPALVASMKEALAKQILDDRSTLVKYACLAIAELSAALGQGFEPAADAVVDALLRVVFKTNLVIRTAACDCVRTILWNASQGFHRVVPRLAGYAVSTTRDPKPKELRAHAVQFLDLVLRFWAVACFERHADAVEGSLRAALVDADPTVRESARMLFWSFNAHFPDRAEGVLAKVEPSVADLVMADEERSVAGPALPHLTPLPAPSSAPAPAPAPPAAPPAARAPPRERTRPSSAASSGGHGLSGPARVGRVAADQPAPEAAPPKRRLAGPSRAARVGQPSSAPSGGGDAGRDASPPRALGGPRRMAGPQRVQRPPSGASSRGRGKPSGGATSPVQGGEEDGGGEDGLRVHILQCRNSDWREREAGLGGLVAIVADRSRRAEVVSSIDQISRVIAPRLEDPNHKVVQAALRAGLALAAGYPVQLRAHVEVVLQPLLGLTASSAAMGQVAAAAQEVVATLASHYDAPELLQVAVKVLGHTDRTEVKEGCLVTMSHLLTHCGVQPFKPMQRLKALLRHLHALLPHRRLTTRVRDILAALHALDSRDLMAALSASAMAVQTDVLASLRDVVPDAASHLAAHHREVPGREEAPRTRPSTAAPPAPVPVAPTSPVVVSTTPSPVASPPPAGVPTSPVDPTPSAPAARVPLSEVATTTESDVLRLAADISIATTHPTQRRSALHALGRLSTTGQPMLWAHCAPDVFSAVMVALCDDDTAVREAALAVTRRLLRNQLSVLCRKDPGAFARTFLARCLACASSCSRELFHSVQRTVSEAMDALDVDAALQALLPYFSGVALDGPPLQLTLRALSFLTPRLGAVGLRPHLNAILPCLLKAFAHTAPDIRKAVVFVFVDLHTVLDEPSYASCVRDLNAVQLKLVSIYVERAAQAAPRRAASPLPMTA